MSRPTLEVADIFRAYGARFIEHSRARVSWPQHKVIRAIERCRTAALGRHRDPASTAAKTSASPSTRAATATVRSARWARATAGSRRAPANWFR